MLLVTRIRDTRWQSYIGSLFTYCIRTGPSTEIDMMSPAIENQNRTHNVCPTIKKDQWTEKYELHYSRVS
jgi:hypothetical protein